MTRAMFLTCAVVLGLAACPAPQPTLTSYFKSEPGLQAAGVKMIPIHTPKGDFKVWVKRVGNNPKLKVLLLHGGPAVPHDYMDAMDSFLPDAGIEYYYYDQLGAGNSDQPNDDTLWTDRKSVV